jgi:hypothetical protein
MAKNFISRNHPQRINDFIVDCLQLPVCHKKIASGAVRGQGFPLPVERWPSG